MKVLSFKNGVKAILLLSLFSCKKPIAPTQNADPAGNNKLASTNSTLIANETVSVDFNVTQDTMTYRSSGILAGMVPNSSYSPPDYLVKPIKAQFHRVNMSYLGPLKWRHDALGMTVILVLSDDWNKLYGKTVWPGGTTGTDWTLYDTFLTNEFNQAIGYGYAANRLHFDIWNEAEGKQFWNPANISSTGNGTVLQNETNRKRFCETYVHAVTKLKALAAAATKTIYIEGPSLSSIRAQNVVLGDPGPYVFISRWLDSAKKFSALPDFLTWHFPGNSNTPGATTPVQEINDVRGLYTARSLGAPKIIINEFINNNDGKFHANPGKVGWLISQHERAGIIGSVHAKFLKLDNQLDNMVTYDTTTHIWHTKGEWWTFMKYGSMTGTKVSTTESANVDLVAAKDADSSQAKILLGNRGTFTGPVTVHLDNVDKSTAMEGNVVFVTVERIPYNNGGEVTKTDTVMQGAYTPSATHKLDITFDWGTEVRDGYVITLGSHSQSRTFEAEALTVESHSSSDVVRIFSDPAASGGAGSIIDANALNDFVGYTIPTVTPGTYVISVRGKKYRSRGMFQLQAGLSGSSSGTNIGPVTDLYNFDPEYVDIVLGKWVTTNTVTLNKCFRFTVADVNASSIDPYKYGLAFDYFTVTKITP